MDSRGHTYEGQRPQTPHEDTGSAATVARLREATEAVLRGDDARAELEAAARQLVAELRETALAPEQMLLRIKRILADGGLRPAHRPATESVTSPPPLTAVYRDVIALCIRLYYEG